MNKTERREKLAQLAPNTPEALAHKCKCGDLNSPDGTGCGQGKNGTKFYYRSNCPIHGHLVPIELVSAP